MQFSFLTAKYVYEKYNKKSLPDVQRLRTSGTVVSFPLSSSEMAFFSRFSSVNCECKPLLLPVVVVEYEFYGSTYKCVI